MRPGPWNSRSSARFISRWSPPVFNSGTHPGSGTPGCKSSCQVLKNLARSFHANTAVSQFSPAVFPQLDGGPASHKLQLCRPQCPLHVFQPITSQSASYRVDTTHGAEAPGWPGQGPCCFEPAVEHVLSDPSHLSQGAQFPLPLAPLTPGQGHRTSP